MRIVHLVALTTLSALSVAGAAAEAQDTATDTIIAVNPFEERARLDLVVDGVDEPRVDLVCGHVDALADMLAQPSFSANPSTKDAATTARTEGEETWTEAWAAPIRRIDVDNIDPNKIRLDERWRQHAVGLDGSVSVIGFADVGGLCRAKITTGAQYHRQWSVPAR